MKKSKKSYEKPELKAVSMLEVGATTCCRATPGTCSNTNRTSRGKGSRTSATS
ncbi:MAG: hypothetical protein PHU91_05270 [Candidatus Omnitrophica bacterium]|nr:hypothetical protein [Candidatus Omnitrophota bacterium]MDD5610503.1 hypothetical protein [Candidatus Omnitrophota bacterium]